MTFELQIAAFGGLILVAAVGHWWHLRGKAELRSEIEDLRQRLSKANDFMNVARFSGGRNPVVTPAGGGGGPKEPV